MSDDTLVVVIAYFVFFTFVISPILLFLYRAGELSLDPWRWLFMGKQPQRKPKNSPPKQTTPQSPPDHP